MITNQFSRSNKTYSTIYSVNKFNVEIVSRYIENKYASMIFFWQYKKDPKDFIKNRIDNNYFNISGNTKFNYDSIKLHNQQSAQQQQQSVIKLVDNYLKRNGKQYGKR